jgi:putative ABC transport system permease protein
VRRVVFGELLHRRSRTLALLLGILVATAAFTVLTGSSETQRLVARGTVAESFRGDYDVLVRPRGSRSAIERRTAQAPPNFLSELAGGITHAQWRRIQRLPGVEVAAPIANVGYVLATTRVPVDVSAAAGTAGAMPTGLVLTSLAAAVAGTVLAGGAALVPAVWLRRSPTVPLLAGE